MRRPRAKYHATRHSGGAWGNARPALRPDCSERAVRGRQAAANPAVLNPSRKRVPSQKSPHGAPVSAPRTPAIGCAPRFAGAGPLISSSEIGTAPIRRSTPRPGRTTDVGGQRIPPSCPPTDVGRLRTEKNSLSQTTEVNGEQTNRLSALSVIPLAECRKRTKLRCFAKPIPSSFPISLWIPMPQSSC